MNVQTHQQRMDHLQEANRVRTRRSHWKRRLRERDASLNDVMGDPIADGMKVFDALLALPKVGRVKANRAMRSVGLGPSSTLGAMTYRQRVELERWFRQ